MTTRIQKSVAFHAPTIALGDPVQRRRLVELTGGLVEELDRLADVAPDAESSHSLRAHLSWAVTEARSVLPDDRYLALIEDWIDEAGALPVKDARLHLRMVRQSLSCAAAGPAADRNGIGSRTPHDDFELWLMAATG